MRCALSAQGCSRGRVLDDGRAAPHTTGPSRSTEHDRSLCMADRPLRDHPRRAAPRQTISTTAHTLRSISNAHATGTAGDGVAMGMPACGHGGNEDAAPLLAILNDRRPTTHDFPGRTSHRDGGATKNDPGPTHQIHPPSSYFRVKQLIPGRRYVCFRNRRQAVTTVGRDDAASTATNKRPRDPIHGTSRRHHR